MPASAIPSTLPTSGSAGSSVKAVSLDAASNGSINVPFDQNPLRYPVIGLSISSAVLLLALVAAMIFGRRRRNTHTFAAAKALGPKSYVYTTPYEESDAFTSEHSIQKH